MIVDQLPRLDTPIASDELPVERGTNLYKATIGSVLDQSKLLTITVGAFSSFPKTISNAKITADMVVLSCAFDTPSVITSDIAWTTSAGQLRLTGSMRGTTEAVITLGRTSY